MCLDMLKCRNALHCDIWILCIESRGIDNHITVCCVKFQFNQRTIGPENAHLKPDLGVLSHNEMTLTLNTHTPLLTS